MNYLADTSQVHELSGLEGWLSDFFGKPQSWYSNVDRIQRELAVLHTEVSTIGLDLWDTIMAKVADMIRAGQATAPQRFTGFDWTVEEIMARLRSVVISQSSPPTDQEIADADSRARMFREMVDFAKRVAPEIREEVNKEAARTRAAVSAAPLRSPAEVGEKAFVEELERRANIFGSWGLGIGILILAALGLFAFGVGRR